jgi:hypothetical protein
VRSRGLFRVAEHLKGAVSETEKRLKQAHAPHRRDCALVGTDKDQEKIGDASNLGFGLGINLWAVPMVNMK